MPTRSRVRGFYRPKNFRKYGGDVNAIQYRSSYELRFMRFCDGNVNVLMWSSEEVQINYLSPKDDKIHRYFPDFLIKLRKADGAEEIQLIEIKPHVETLPPKINKSKTGRVNRKRLLAESLTYAVNQAKWRHARVWCEKRGIKFVVLTERELFDR